jgi:hypothetical protein
MRRWHLIVLILAASCGGGGLPTRDASADRIHDAFVGGTASAASSSAGGGGVRGSGGATGGSGGSTASSYIACSHVDCHSDRYRCLGSAAYQRVRTYNCSGSNGASAICGLDTCGSRCIDDGEAVPCPAGTVCEYVYARDPAYACQPDSGTAGRGGSSGGNTATTPSSGGVGGQSSSSGGSSGSSGGTSGHSSNTACSAADCYNHYYQCLDSHEGYYRLRTVYCDRETASVCGSDTCGTRCIKDGAPVMCPAGTICPGLVSAWTLPEDACQPDPMSGMSSLDAGAEDASPKDARSN